MVTNPAFIRVPDPSNGTGQLTHSPLPLDQTVTQWLRDGAPRVTSRSHPTPATRPFIPLALFSFFDGVISLPQCSQLIAQHLAHSSSHVAAQEFTRADGTLKFSYTRLTTEVVDCCRIYQFPQPSHGGPPPLAGPRPAQGPSGSMPAPALNV